MDHTPQRTYHLYLLRFSLAVGYLTHSSNRPYTYTDRDQRFENDLETVTRDIFRYIYRSDQEKQVIFDNDIQYDKILS